uniref:Uncharacterized protein n=1 Tax=Rhizophora mucronata TaxID=61149 RepID=A0A2P2JYQ5_RHIMU
MSFLTTFMATYLAYLLGFMAILYFNPYWRQRWFLFIENFIDNIPKLFTRVARRPYFV